MELSSLSSQTEEGSRLSVGCEVSGEAQQPSTLNWLRIGRLVALPDV